MTVSFESYVCLASSLVEFLLKRLNIVPFYFTFCSESSAPVTFLPSFLGVVTEAANEDLMASNIFLPPFGVLLASVVDDA